MVRPYLMKMSCVRLPVCRPLSTCHIDWLGRTPAHISGRHFCIKLSWANRANKTYLGCRSEQTSDFQYLQRAYLGTGPCAITGVDMFTECLMGGVVGGGMGGEWAMNGFYVRAICTNCRQTALRMRDKLVVGFGWLSIKQLADHYLNRLVWRTPECPVPENHSSHSFACRINISHTLRLCFPHCHLPLALGRKTSGDPDCHAHYLQSSACLQVSQRCTSFLQWWWHSFR